MDKTINAQFHPAVTAWFEGQVGQPTECQSQAWTQVYQGRNVIITAPTGSGKTLAAFLSSINHLVEESLRLGGLAQQTRVLYISPLRALSNDIEKNLQLPLSGIDQQLEKLGLPAHGITSAVRSGDTSAWQRQKINRNPPHILVTTPESFYILLTSKSGRQLLSSIDSVIVDEIHALIDSKRGAHLSLSLQRLKALLGRDFQRIGLSATIKDKSRVAEFLCNRAPYDVVDAGSLRKRDIQIWLPDTALTAVMSEQVWGQIYDQVVYYSQQHQTVLVFVNTRRLAEKMTRQLAERMDEDLIATHHGSLSRAHRLDAETRLKNGRLKVLVATASLELGIDIGDVDLVCQIGSTASIATCLQRIGRSGHGVDRVPKGRLLPTTVEELVESVALIDAIENDQLDTLLNVDAPLDVLAQQIIAEVSAKDWSIDALYDCFSESVVFKRLAREKFDQLIVMLNRGFTNRRGARFAYLHVDAVNGVISARKSARITALTNGGAIPELFDYDVVLLPDNFRVGSVNEDFAFESMIGDIFQLGNTSYRICKVETGRVLVEDAKGQPPSIPFWFGEAPGRSFELSDAVNRLMQFCNHLFERSESDPWAMIKNKYQLSDPAAQQVHDHLYSAYLGLGQLPSFNSIVFERFFDENDDMHLVIHSLYGSRLNRAWGLALRKRFCRKFNFELQAAALENSIILSLGATHSFPLEEIKDYLQAKTVKNILIQAMLDAPIFNTHWRWVCNISLAVRRFNAGKRIAPQIQRNNAEDLAAQVFPDQLACLENIAGDREIPEHPLVEQAINDCIYEVMDIGALEALLEQIHRAEVELVFRDVAKPSSLSQAIINARSYAFLDDAPAEERRTQALSSGLYGRSEDIIEYGLIPDFAISQVRQENRPLIRNADELHDALCVYGLLSSAEIGLEHQRLVKQMRANSQVLQLNLSNEICLYYAPEWQAVIQWLYPSQFSETKLKADSKAETRSVFFKQVSDEVQAMVELIRAQLELHSPVTLEDLALILNLPAAKVSQALLSLEQQGVVMRGEYIKAEAVHWCERRILARLHRLSLAQKRSLVQAVSPQAYMQFLLSWQQLTPQTQGRGVNAVMAVIEKLQGFPVAITMWPQLLKQRIAGFEMAQLESLFLAGQLVWLRPAMAADTRSSFSLKKNSQVMIYKREVVKYLPLHAPPDINRLSSTALHLLEIFKDSTGLYFDELVERSRLLKTQVEMALSELIASGLVACDSFQSLLKLLGEGKKKRQLARRIGQQIPYAGRWYLNKFQVSDVDIDEVDICGQDKQLQMACEILLARYGVLFYSLLERETNVPTWRQLRSMLKRMEARGDILAGRFVSEVQGEQFALKQAAAELGKLKPQLLRQCLPISSVDPVNLSRTFALGEPVAVNAKTRFVFEQGEFLVCDDQLTKMNQYKTSTMKC